MPNPIFQGNGGNPMLDRIAMMRSMLTGNPEQMYNQMYQSNPKFREFADGMKGKTVEQAYMEHGQDPNQIRNMFGL